MRPTLRHRSRCAPIFACLLGGCGTDDTRDSGDVGTASTITTEPTTVADATSSGSATSSSPTTAETSSSPGETSSSGGSSVTDATTSTTGSVDSTGGTDVCAGVRGEALIPPTMCDGPSGNTSTEVPSNGLFSTSWFGCYFDEGGELIQDASDNCEFACGPQGLCDDFPSGPECEANLKWFAADADRYGCGARIRVTNCDNGNAVILATLDRGPNCGNEMDCETPVLDMSHDAMIYLFEGAEYGGCEQVTVVVEQVDDGTALGPV